MKKQRKLSINVVFVFAAIITLLDVGVTILATALLRKELHESNADLYASLSHYIAVFSGVVAMFLFALFVQYAIVKRIKKLQVAVNSVAGGDYSVKLEYKENGDEIDSVAASFDRMTEELKTNEYLSKEFARNVSHEFKTPLSIIRGYAETLQGEELSGEAKESVEIIINEADRLARLSEALMEVSALDSSAIIKKDDLFRPSEQIRTLIQNAQILLERKSLTVEAELNDADVCGNERLMYEVWQNLLDNAVKFCKEDGKIKIKLAITGGALAFEIFNEGERISEADGKKIFSLFYMGDKSRCGGGSGVGLYLSQKICAKLGGNISFSNAEGGVTFSVTLPCAQPESMLKHF